MATSVVQLGFGAAASASRFTRREGPPEGDYAGLDSDSITRHKRATGQLSHKSKPWNRLRQGSAALGKLYLVLAIVLLVGNEAFGAVGGGGLPHITETGSPRPPINIAIVDTAMHGQADLVRSRISNGVGVNQVLGYFNLTGVQKKPRKGSSDFACWGGISGECFKEVIWQPLLWAADNNDSEYTHISRRGGSKITDFHVHKIIVDDAGGGDIERKSGIVLVGDFKRQFFQPNVSPQLSFIRVAGLADLTQNDDGEGYRRDNQRPRPKSNNVLGSLANNPGYVRFISVLVGIFCAAIGIALYLRSDGLMGRLAGIALIPIGVLTPVFPWWVFVIAPIVGGYK